MTPPTAAAPAAGRIPVVLAIDTTAASCSAAVIRDACVWRVAQPMLHGHSRHLLGLVARVLDEAGVSPDAVAAIGFGCGPGAFTGLRIACGVAQGLGLGWGRPLVAVDAMRTLALQAAGALPAGTDPATPVCVALDVRMGEVCRAVFTLDALAGDTWPVARLDARLGPPAEAIAAFESVGPRTPVLAGDGFDRHEALRRWSGARLRPEAAIQPDAGAVATLAAIGLHAGRAVDAADAAPLYLRDKVALDVDEQAALRRSRLAAEAP